MKLASNPVLVGAVTILVTTVAVFLAYNANNGLPFVPTYRVSIEVPNVPGVTGGGSSGGQSVNPNDLLDYLLSP